MEPGDSSGSGQLLHNIFAKNNSVCQTQAVRQEKEKKNFQFGALANKIVTEDGPRCRKGVGCVCCDTDDCIEGSAKHSSVSVDP